MKTTQFSRSQGVLSILARTCCIGTLLVMLSHTATTHAQVVIDLPPPPAPTPTLPEIEIDPDKSSDAVAIPQKTAATQSSALSSYVSRVGPHGTYYSSPWYQSNVQYGSYRYPYGYKRSIGYRPYVGVPIYSHYGYGHYYGHGHHKKHDKHERSYRHHRFDMNGSRRFGGHDFGASGRVRYDGDNVRVRIKF